MGKFEFGDGQYVVYAENEQAARQIVSQELKRFDTIKEKMASLLTPNGAELQKFMSNTSDDSLNIHFNDAESSIYDKDPSAKGEVRQRKVKNNQFSYDLAYRYPEIDGQDANFRLAHEMGHLMLNPANVKEQVYDKDTNSRQVAGLIRRDESTKKIYGEQMQENAINLLAQLGIRGNIKADDIIEGKVDLSEFNNYKKCDELINMLAISMKNAPDMSFEDLANGKLDSLIIYKDGTKEPANTFFYGILNDSSIIQKDFDKYLGDGAWRELNSAFEKMYSQNISKDQFDLIYSNAKGLIQEFSNIRAQDREQYKNKEIDDEKTEEGNIYENQPDEKLTFKQKIAMFLQKHSIFNNLGFAEDFIQKNLNGLPEGEKNQDTNIIRIDTKRQDFINKLTNFGEYRNLPPIQRMSDQRKLDMMKEKMSKNPKVNDNNER